MTPTLTPSCEQCARPFSATRSDARTCGATCRMAAWRGRLMAWRDLALRQTEAAVAGDTAALDALVLEAARLDRLDTRTR